MHKFNKKRSNESPDKGPPCTNLTGKEAMKEITSRLSPEKRITIPSKPRMGTKKVLHLLRKMMTKAKEHKLVAQRTYLVIQHGMPGSLASCGNS